MQFTPSRAVCGAVIGAGLCVASSLPAQTSSVPAASSTPCAAANQGTTTPDPACPPPAPAAPAAKRFPYPGEEQNPAAAAPAVQQPSSAPQVPAAHDASQPAGKRFPYPSEAGSAPAPAANSPLTDAGSSGESSSSSNSSSSSSSSSGASDSSSSSSSGGSADPDANDPAAVPRRDRHKLPPVPRQTPSEREQEDVQVAGFYFNDGNYKGSYDRALDAVSLDNEDAAAQLALGNAARKLGRLDEAEKAFRRCLALDPVPRVRKPAERALHEMTGEN